tara:strand:- start:168469 stop:169254 length:786 start_codon:yes stop_codon:yes gene_type:complete
MNRELAFLVCLAFLASCSTREIKDSESMNNSSDQVDKGELTPQLIVAESYAYHGCEKINSSSISFDFRDKHYDYLHTDSGLVRLRTFQDSSGRTVKDVWSRNNLERFIDDSLINISDDKEKAYVNSINSVFYFAFLPKSLKDPAVNLEYIDTVEISKKAYHKIKVTFDEEGGGEDHEDVFIYWFSLENYRLDYLAYSYETNGGGMRFRSVIDRDEYEGIILQDYANFAPPEGAKLNDLDQLYENGELKQVSTIELKNIMVK